MRCRSVRGREGGRRRSGARVGNERRLGPIGDVDGDFDVGVDDGLVHDLVAVAVLRSRELLSRDDL